MSSRPSIDVDEPLAALVAVLDSQAGRYASVRQAPDFGAYVEAKGDRADEEILTEPVLAAVLERVLGFPTDAYFPQYGKGGQKPDFTPMDLIAHPFVLDAKSSALDLKSHEPQIRRYMSQRSLDYGVLFNLREVRVFRRDAQGHDPELSFAVLPLWRVGRGEALPAAEVQAFARFCERSSYRTMGLAEKIEHVRRERSWSTRLATGESVEVDIEYLVEQLRMLSKALADDAGMQLERLEDHLRFNPARRSKLLEELRLIALDIAPGTDLGSLPGDLDGWHAEDLPGRVWRQYLLRVAYLALTRILLYRAWEDVELVDSYLYDGGFDREYARLSNDVQRVLREAFRQGSERYEWLYGRANNYDWFRPREPALVEVLYRLAPIPLGRLDADVLGGLTSRTWSRSTGIGSVSSSRRGRWSGSCSTGPGFAVPTACSGSKRTSGARAPSSTSQPARAGSSSTLPAESSRTVASISTALARSRRRSPRSRLDSSAARSARSPTT